MKKVFLISVFGLIYSLVIAGNRTHQRLSKIYRADQNKCLEVSRRIIKRSPTNASPYYFACKIYLDQVPFAHTTVGEYHRMKSAISYARRFEKYRDKDMPEDLGWGEMISSIERQSKDIVDRLESEGELYYSDALLKKVNVLSSEVHEIEMVDHHLVHVRGEELEAKMTGTASDLAVNRTATAEAIAMYMGMPGGDEDVLSHNYASEQEMFSLINKQRVALGMAELEWEEDLARASRYHASDLGVQGYFEHSTHDRQNGKLERVGGTFDRIRKFYTASFINSENIAAGNEEARLTYKQWYDSKGHYDNMFNPTAKKTGIGVVYVPGSPYGYYWVMCTAE